MNLEQSTLIPAADITPFKLLATITGCCFLLQAAALGFDSDGGIEPGSGELAMKQCFILPLGRGLRKLGLAETSVGTKGLSLLSALTALVSLDLGGCPVTDPNLLSFQALKLLEQLDLWGSKVTNIGAHCLSSFKFLKYLNLAMTAVTVTPQMSSIVSLYLCNCGVESIYGKEDFIG